MWNFQSLVFYRCQAEATGLPRRQPKSTRHNLTHAVFNPHDVMTLQQGGVQYKKWKITFYNLAECFLWILINYEDFNRNRLIHQCSPLTHWFSLVVWTCSPLSLHRCRNWFTNGRQLTMKSPCNYWGASEFQYRFEFACRKLRVNSFHSWSQKTLRVCLFNVSFFGGFSGIEKLEQWCQ